EGVTFIKTLLKGAPATLGGASAHLPWIKRAPPVFLAASHPKPLQAAGRTADGGFANYGLAADNIRDSRAQILAGAKAAGRAADDIEIWQIAALDCNEDRNAARNKVGAMLAFLAGYVIGDKHLETRGVPEPLRAPLLELRRRYSTRPGEADIPAGRRARPVRLSGAPAVDLRQSAGLSRADARRQSRWRRAADAHRQPRLRSGANRRTVRRTRASKTVNCRQSANRGKLRACVETAGITHPSKRAGY